MATRFPALMTNAGGMVPWKLFSRRMTTSFPRNNTLKQLPGLSFPRSCSRRTRSLLSMRSLFTTSDRSGRTASAALGTRHGYSSAPAPATAQDNEARVSSSLQGAKISVAEGVPNMGVGRSVWESGLRMVDYLEKNNRDSLRGAKVLELGTGTGIVGISVASLGANVVLTDREEKLLGLVNKNIEANRKAIKAGGGSAKTEIMDWSNRAGTSTVALTEGPFDYIIASDILYSSPSHGMLLETLWQCACVDTKVLIAYPSRDLEWEVRSKGVDPVPPDERCMHKFSQLTAQRFHIEIVSYYPPSEPRRGNKGYSVYVMSMQLK
mmetsp:Transcript_5370/g.9002  ORF Transcript_5370/g.9002 Transcript_5370/m.9002 type:complete len:322 (+) Transcript_5370:128-1093(+)